MGKCCGQGGAGGGAQGTYRDMNNKRCVSGAHDEEVCHGTNERRRDLMDQLKIFLDEFDDRPCKVPPIQKGPDAVRPLGQYPEYLKKHCQSWMPPNPNPPLITSVQAHEIRPTEDYEKKKKENNEYITYVDGRVKPPPPSCDCAKRNGLQDQCPRPECTPPTPQCLATNPGPCCPPSLGLTGREAAQGQQPVGRAPDQWVSTSHRTYAGPQSPAPTPDQWISTTHLAFGGPQPSAPTPDQWVSTTHRAYGGSQSNIKLVCFCRTPPSSMPSGKKYICCPAPQS